MSCFFPRAANGMNGHDVLPDISSDLPPSRPFTPNEQMDIMRAFEDHELSETGEPSARDEEVGCIFCNARMYKSCIIVILLILISHISNFSM